MINCSIIVNSCDAYSDIWYPYFELFKKYWSNCPYSVYLNTESRMYTDDSIRLQTVNYSGDDSSPSNWSDRLIAVLQKCDADIVLFTMDDHFLLDTVDQAGFEELIEYMVRHQRIACMSFLTQDENKHFKTFRHCWQKQPSTVPLRVNCQTALWNKKELLKLLRSGESAWDFEGRGTERAIWSTKTFYRYIGKPNWPKPILDYAQHVYRGYGVFQGKWLWNNEDLFCQNGIEYDLSVRGVMSKEEFYQKREERIKRETASSNWRDNGKLLSQIYMRIPKKLLISLSKTKRRIIRN